MDTLPKFHVTIIFIIMHHYEYLFNNKYGYGEKFFGGLKHGKEGIINDY